MAQNIMEAQSLLLPIFSLIGVVVGGGVQYLLGRELESRKQLALQRSQSYVDYFKAMALLAHGKESSSLSLATDAKTRICLYGSSNVIGYLRKFEEVGAITSSSEAQVVLVGLIKAMRQDISKDNLVPDDEALWRILFGPAR